MNNLQVFDFNGNDIRAFEDENGEPWFFAGDITKVLEITNISQTLSYLDEDEKGIISNDTLRGVQNISIVSESGMYSLVLRSRKPEAKKFKKWVTSEVLPKIRKDGYYVAPAKAERLINDPDEMIKFSEDLLLTLKATNEAKKEAEALAERYRIRTEIQEKELKLSAPKVSYYDEVLQTEDVLTTTIIAKDLGMSALALNKLLHQKGVIYKSQDTWVLYYKYQNEGHTKTQTHTFVNSKGETHSTVHTYWTQKGREFIHSVLQPKGLTKTQSI